MYFFPLFNMIYLNNELGIYITINHKICCSILAELTHYTKLQNMFYKTQFARFAQHAKPKLKKSQYGLM